MSLTGSEPRIWRRVRIAADLPLTAVHAAIQIAMEWDAVHLYSFSFGADVYQANPLNEDDLDDVALEDVAHKGDRFSYTYDFGDNWQHDVLVEEVVIPGRASQPVLCLDGAMPTPPEDCGGLASYVRMRENGELDDDDDDFDLEAINEELTDLFGVVDYQTRDFVDEDGQPLPYIYDPDQPLDEAWDELSTDEQLWSVAAYHFWLVAAGGHAPVEILSAHALMHATVELHVASRSPVEAADALSRLCGQGVPRHQALHSLATALEEAMLGSEDTERDDFKQAYVESLRSLGTSTAATQH